MRPFAALPLLLLRLPTPTGTAFAVTPAGEAAAPRLHLVGSPDFAGANASTVGFESLQHVWRHGLTDHPLHAAAESEAFILRPGYWLLPPAAEPASLAASLVGASGSATSSHGQGDGVAASRSFAPREQVRGSCTLSTLGGGSVRTPVAGLLPDSSCVGDPSTVLLLHDAGAELSQAWNEDLFPLVELLLSNASDAATVPSEPPCAATEAAAAAAAGRPHVQLLLLSYGPSEEEVERKMREMQGRFRAAMDEEAWLSVKDRLHFVTQPAWRIPLQSPAEAEEECWLAGVLRAWSTQQGQLTVSAQRLPAARGGGAEGDAVELLVTDSTGTRGDWAPKVQEPLEGRLLYYGFACSGPLPSTDAALVDEGLLPPEPASGTALPSGSIALVPRGVCSFYSKVHQAQEAGAAAVVIFQLVGAPPIEMACGPPDPCDEVLSIPAVMVDALAGMTMLRALNDTNHSTVARLDSISRGPQFVGLVGEGGGLRQLGRAEDGLRSFADEALGMERERRIATQRAQLRTVVAETGSQGATLLPIFDGQQFNGSLLTAWSSQQARALREKGYDTLDMELWLDCPGHLDAHCGPWDFLLDLYLCEPRAPHCNNASLNVGRWITAYGREGRWLSRSSGSALQQLLLLPGSDSEAGHEDRVLHLFGAGGQHYIVTLFFWLRRTGTSQPRVAMGPPLTLWQGGQFAGYNEVHEPISFRTPPGSSTAVLSMLLTGHGWGRDEFNCAEFCNHSHFFSVNGADPVVRDFPIAGTEVGCEQQVSLGSVPNQYGTWFFGRSGWCPGKQVDWWEVDITHLLAAGGEWNNISYWAMLNGAEYNATPSDDPIALGFPANIDLASFLTFYTDAPVDYSVGSAAFWHTLAAPWAAGAVLFSVAVSLFALLAPVCLRRWRWPRFQPFGLARLPAEAGVPFLA